MIKIYLFTLFFVEFITQDYKSLNLLNLKSQWGANGVGHLIPNGMKIFSPKLNNQITSLYTYTPFVAGNNWNLNYSLNYSCQNDPSDFGIVIQLSELSRSTSREHYSHKLYHQFFGMQPSLNGVAILHLYDQVHIGVFNKVKVTREEMIYQTKPCKVFRDKDNNIHMKIKQDMQGKLIVYNIQSQTGEERICAQLSDIRLQKLHMGISGTDTNGQCDANILQAILSSQNDFQIVQPQDKQVGDNNYAYFPENKEKQQEMENKRFASLANKMREDMKVVAKELLDFADRNEKELIQDFKTKMDQQTEQISHSLEIIERESIAIQMLGNYATQNSSDMKFNIEDTLDQILSWMNQMESAFVKIDDQTLKMYESIKKIGLDEKLSLLVEKSDEIQSKLNSILKKSNLANQNNPLKKMDEEQFSNFLENLNNEEQNSEISKIFEIKGIKFIGLGLLFGIALCVLFGFGYMYWKIKKTINHKRMI